MKKLIFCLSLIFFLSNQSFSQTEQEPKNESAKKTEYCILRVYHGIGVYIIYEDLKIETHPMLGNKTPEVLQTTMVYINQLKIKGFSLISSTSSDPSAFEYIFKKEK